MGRGVNRQDVAVIRDEAARVLFQKGDPLGATVAGTAPDQFTVVGVVSDVANSLERAGPPLVYVIPADRMGALTVVVRMRTRQDGSMTEVKGLVSTLAPGTPITASWWTDRISALNAYRNPRFQTPVLGAFATLALVLVAVGIFGVVAVLVAMRRHEMGVRLAIGATPRSLVVLVVRQALIPLLAGLVSAVVGVPWIARLADAQRFTIDVRDPAIAALAVLTVMATASVAAYIPARRASRVDPVSVLRTE